VKISNSSFWVKFEEFGFYYRIKQGILKQADITSSGEVCGDSKIVVSQIPNGLDSEYFFTKINEEFGTNFTALN